ncbi:MAG: hypothetical protein LBT53_01415 [Puniceicoccales bacterium]|jgi:hypothetical protein|nr:hypothetical protein [Puniceicoccales bacterium]
MGRNLAIGLTYQAIASHKEMTEQKVSVDELRQAMQETLRYDMSIYDEETVGDRVLFTLKDAVFKEGLLPFLEAFYPAIRADKDEYPPTLKRLQSTPSAQWFDIAKKGEECLFQFDEYAESDNVWFQKNLRTYIRLRYNCILLYLGHGKIITEGMNDFTTFFKDCLHATFKDHAIARALRFYVTG